MTEFIIELYSLSGRLFARQNAIAETSNALQAFCIAVYYAHYTRWA